MPKYRVVWNAIVQCTAAVEAEDENDALQKAGDLPMYMAHPHVVQCTLEDLRELKESPPPKCGEKEE